MVSLIITPTISSAIDEYFNDYEKHGQDMKLSKSSAEDYVMFISHKDLIVLSKTTSYSLSKLVVNSSIYHPPKAQPAPKTAEYLKLMEQLRLQQQEREYQELVGVSFKSEADRIETPGAMVKEVKEQLSTIVNVLLSVFSVGYAVWYWSGTSTHWAVPTRTLMSVLASLLVVVAETGVYLGYKYRISEARKAEQAKQEVKTPLVGQSGGAKKSEPAVVLKAKTATLSSAREKKSPAVTRRKERRAWISSSRWSRHRKTLKKKTHTKKSKNQIEMWGRLNELED